MPYLICFRPALFSFLQVADLQYEGGEYELSSVRVESLKIENREGGI